MPTTRPDGTARHRGAWRRRSLFIVKATVSVGVLLFLIERADWPGLVEKLEAAWWPGMLGGTALVLAGLLLGAERWAWSVASAGGHLGRRSALRIAFVTLFFGQVLPSGLGGDAVRGWLTFRGGADGRVTITAMLVDRILSLFGNLALMAATLPWLHEVAPTPMVAAVGVIVVGLTGGVALAAQADRLPLARFMRVRPVVMAMEQTALLRAALTTRAALVSAAAAVAMHVTTCLAIVAFGAALGVALPPGAALSVVPIAILATALPISLNGWGAREGAMAAGLALYGISTAQALTMSLLIGLAQVLLALPGGVIWLALRRSGPLRPD